jgi:hypothetical protein
MIGIAGETDRVRAAVRPADVEVREYLTGIGMAVDVNPVHDMQADFSCEPTQMVVHELGCSRLELVPVDGIRG